MRESIARCPESRQARRVTTERGPARAGYSEALVSHEFRALLLAQLMEVGAVSLVGLALTILVYRDTSSPLLSSLTFALGFVPYALGGGLLSGVVDRARPRALVAGCDCSSAALVIAMAWPGLPLPVLFALLVAAGILSSISSGARAALTRATVTERAYVPARSLLRISSQLAQIAGNAGGGGLLLLISVRGAVLTGACTFALSALSTRLGVSDHPSDGRRGEGTLLRDSLRGTGEIFAHRELRRLLLVGWLAPMFAVAPEALAAPYVSAHGGASSIVGWWLVALPIGMIAGDVAGVALLSADQQKRMVAPAAAAGFVPYLLFVFDPAIAAAVALLVASGCCSAYTLGLDARVRDSSPPQLFARVMTLNFSGLIAIQGVGFALAGAVGQAIGPADAIATAGICGLAIIVALMRDELGLARHRSLVPSSR
jgi:hypothetical protein